MKSDDDLFCYFDDRLQGKDKEMVCPGKGCDCLTILKNACVREAIARYLVWYERKSKYDQTLLLMEWYRYASRSGWRYLVPFDGDTIEDDLVLNSVLKHRLCQRGLFLLMGVGERRLRSIRAASQVTCILPSHKGKGRMAHNSIKNDDPCFLPLKANFEYLLNLGEV